MATIARGVEDRATPCLFADRITDNREAVADAVKATLVDVPAAIINSNGNGNFQSAVSMRCCCAARRCACRMSMYVHAVVLSD
jgi:hypothetical protein